jgi:hypothetical protein
VAGEKMAKLLIVTGTRRACRCTLFSLSLYQLEMQRKQKGFLLRQALRGKSYSWCPLSFNCFYGETKKMYRHKASFVATWHMRKSKQINNVELTEFQRVQDRTAFQFRTRRNPSTQQHLVPLGH